MSRRAVDTVFQSMFALTDIRMLLRETAPAHALDDLQKERARALLTDLEKQVRTLREELNV